MIRRSFRRRIGGAAAMAVLLTGLAGCGGKPMEFPTPESEMGNRPGLFTGDQGSWGVLSRSSTKTPAP